MERTLFFLLSLVSLPVFSFLNIVEVYMDSSFCVLILSVQVCIVILAFFGFLEKKVEEIILGIIMGFWIGCVSSLKIYEKLNYLFQLKNAFYQSGEQLFCSGKFNFFSPGELNLSYYSSFWERLDNFSLFSFNFWLAIALVILIIVVKQKVNIKKGIIGGLTGLLIIGVMNLTMKKWEVNFNKISINNPGFYLYEEKPKNYFFWLYFQKKEIPIKIKLDAISKALNDNVWDADFFIQDPDIIRFGNLVQRMLKLKTKLTTTSFRSYFLNVKLKTIEHMIKGNEYFISSYLKRISNQSNQSYITLIDLSREEFLKAFLKSSSTNIYAYQALAGK